MGELAGKSKQGSQGEAEPLRPEWHTVSMRVPLFEVDLGQAVYHGNYYHFLEVGRSELLRDLGYPYSRFMDQQLHLTIVEASCSYRKSLHYDDLIEIRTGIAWCRRRSIGFSQQIWRIAESEPGELCTRADVRMVCVRFSGQPTTLPQDFVDLLPEQARKSARD
jgi:acyl-CoA thioester hydrolase